ncbi:MAG: geranylgeranylglyceryl/heptaprenylglyceryl phosphate synthase [Lishizhenia sp.]
MITTSILKQFNSKKGQIAVLIDPDKIVDEHSLTELVKKAIIAEIDYFFVGGSTATQLEVETVVSFLKLHCKIPVVLFPGNPQQLSKNANALLYLSLISGRNPDFLIGHHVNSAQEVNNLDIEKIPTAYILIDGGTKSSVAYVSQTTPIPETQIKIAVNTAIAGKLQGKQLIFFDAGSGAKNTIKPILIKETQQKVDAPIIVGGGIQCIQNLMDLKDANVLVIGNKLEQDVDFLLDIKQFKKNCSVSID